MANTTVDEFDLLLDAKPKPTRKCGTCTFTAPVEALSSGGQARSVVEAIEIWANRLAAGTTKLSIAGLHKLLVERAGYPYQVGALQAHIRNHLPRKGGTD